MRAGIYCRVSKDARGDARSVEEQEEACRGWVERERWTLTDVYRDNDLSASRYAKKARPDWQRLTEDLADGKMDVLVVWEVSRSTRDRMVWAALVAACQDRGVKLCLGGRLHDLDDPDDAFMADLGAMLAVRESGMTSKRVRRTVASNAAKGRPHGKNLYGYRRTYDPTSGALVSVDIYEPEAAIIREIARRMASGESRKSIAKDLNDRGVPVARPEQGGGKWRRSEWDLGRIREIVTNAGYIGKRTLRGQIVGDAIWPPIIDEPTYWACVTLVNAQAGNSRAGTVRHELSGAATCGKPAKDGEGRCAGPLRVLKCRTYFAYTCPKCFGVSIRKETFEEYVRAVVFERLSRPDAIDLLSTGPTDGAVQEAIAEAAKKRALLSEYVDQAVAGAISPASFAAIESRLNSEIQAAERRAKRASLPLALVDAVRPDIASVWLTWPVDRRRAVISALFVDIILHTTGKGRRKFDPSRVELQWRT